VGNILGGRSGRPTAAARTRAIAEIAARQHGAVTRRQLLDTGFGSDAIKHRIESDLLHRRSKAGIRLHRAHHIDRLDVRSVDHLAVTAPARSLLDFAADATPDALELAVAEGLRRRVVSVSSIESAIGRAPQRRGAAALSALMRSQFGPAFTRSEAERMLLRDQMLGRRGTEGHTGDMAPDNRPTTGRRGPPGPGHQRRAGVKRRRILGGCHATATPCGTGTPFLPSS
jgi:hypothetical protein